jgi:eukaryotic-like serine/threonine-protein kinase
VSVSESNPAQTIVLHRASATVSTDTPLPLVSVKGRYELFSEIGRGGGGIVYRAHDHTVDRPVAVKVLHQGGRGDSLTLRRFNMEARLTASLAHPAIPPVHDVGELPDGRPYLAMKLIEGRTLSDLLKEHPGKAVRWLPVFEAISQAVGFAHSRGVIHRDLKPSNVMVGSFGEVQVMDWGLAKQLDSPERFDEATSASKTITDSIGSKHTSRTGPSANLTHVGQVLGTPAYLSPEQACGDPATARSDVFGLGAILFEILTGRPPFEGNEQTSALMRAAIGDLAEAFNLLTTIDCDPELKAVCRACLSSNPADRPADGAAVSAAITGLRLRTEHRVRAAETARATAEIQAREERKRRRIQIAMIGCLFALGLVGGVATIWNERVVAERDRQRTITQDIFANRQEKLTEIVTFTIDASYDLRRRGLWNQARQSLLKVQASARNIGLDEAIERIDVALKEVQFLQELDQIRMNKVLEHDKTEVWDSQRSADAYSATFIKFGYDVTQEDPAQLVQRLQYSAARNEILAALDDWGLDEKRPNVRAAIWNWTRTVTGQSWRSELVQKQTPEELKTILDLVPDADRSPAILAAFGIARYETDRSSITLLAAGCRKYPSDFWLMFCLGNALYQIEDETDNESAGCFRACLALRPEYAPVWICLAQTLLSKGDLDEAESCYRRALYLDSSSYYAHTDLAKISRERGRPQEALVHLKNALDLNPNFTRAQYHIGLTFRDLGRWDEAEAAMRLAIQSSPGTTRPYYYLAKILRDRRKFSELGEVWEKVTQMEPEAKSGWLQLANYHMEHAEFDQAIRAFEHAIKLDPSDGKLYTYFKYTERLQKLHQNLPEVLAHPDSIKSSREISDYAIMASTQASPCYAKALALFERVEALDAGQFETVRQRAIDCVVRYLGGYDAKQVPSPEEQTRLHSVVRNWMKAELNTIHKLAESREHTRRRKCREFLQPLFVQTDWACIRDPDQLAKLPESEQQAWTAFWADVRSVYEKAVRANQR